MLSRRVNYAEIQPGLVLHLDPVTLEAEDATCTCVPELRVADGHFFLCIGLAGDTGRWLPLFTNDGIGRYELVGAKSGHPKWTGTRSFFHPSQIWIAGSKAVIEAAAAGLDMSSPGARNSIAVSAIPRL